MPRLKSTVCPTIDIITPIYTIQWFVILPISTEGTNCCVVLSGEQVIVACYHFFLTKLSFLMIHYNGHRHLLKVNHLSLFLQVNFGIRRANICYLLIINLARTYITAVDFAPQGENIWDWFIGVGALNQPVFVTFFSFHLLAITWSVFSIYSLSRDQSLAFTRYHVISLYQSLSASGCWGAAYLKTFQMTFDYICSSLYFAPEDIEVITRSSYHICSHILWAKSKLRLSFGPLPVVP